MEVPKQAGGSNSISAASGMANKSAMLFWPLVILWYSSAVSSTWDGRPRSVIRTGPLLAALLARLVS